MFSAPDDVRMYIFPDTPDYSKEKVLLGIK